MSNLDLAQILALLLWSHILTFIAGVTVESWWTARWLQREKLPASGFACEEDRANFDVRR